MVPSVQARRRTTFKVEATSVAGIFEVDDLFHVEADRLKDRVAVLVELRGPRDDAGSPSLLHRHADEAERRATGRLVLDQVAVGDRLRILRHLQRVLGDRPLADERLEPHLPLGEGRPGEHLVEDGDRIPAVRPSARAALAKNAGRPSVAPGAR